MGSKPFEYTYTVFLSCLFPIYFAPISFPHETAVWRRQGIMETEDDKVIVIYGAKNTGIWKLLNRVIMKLNEYIE